MLHAKQTALRALRHRALNASRSRAARTPSAKCIRPKNATPLAPNTAERETRNYAQLRVFLFQKNRAGGNQLCRELPTSVSWKRLCPSPGGIAESRTLARLPSSHSSREESFAQLLTFYANQNSFAAEMPKSLSCKRQRPCPGNAPESRTPATAPNSLPNFHSAG